MSVGISFSTTATHTAKERLSLPVFSWMNESQKELVLKNLDNGMRVQCPMMYSSPKVEIHGDSAVKLRVQFDLLGGKTKEEILDSSFWWPKHNLWKMRQAFDDTKELLYKSQWKYIKAEEINPVFEPEFNCDSVTKKKVISLLARVYKKTLNGKLSSWSAEDVKAELIKAQADLASYLEAQKGKYGRPSPYCRSRYFEEQIEKLDRIIFTENDIKTKQAEMTALLKEVE